MLLFLKKKCQDFVPYLDDEKSTKAKKKALLVESRSTSGRCKERNTRRCCLVSRCISGLKAQKQVFMTKYPSC